MTTTTILITAQSSTAADSSTRAAPSAASTSDVTTLISSAGSVCLEGNCCSHLECGCSVSRFNISVDTTDSAQAQLLNLLNLVLQPY